MRNQFVEGGTCEQAEEKCPWAAEIIEVDGGWRCFESISDADTFQTQA